MLKRLFALSGAVAMAVLFTIWAPRPGERPSTPTQFAMYRYLPLPGMMTPRDRYQPPYEIKYRGSGRRTRITTEALG